MDFRNVFAQVGGQLFEFKHHASAGPVSLLVSELRDPFDQPSDLQHVYAIARERQRIRPCIERVERPSRPAHLGSCEMNVVIGLFARRRPRGTYFNRNRLN